MRGERQIPDHRAYYNSILWCFPLSASALSKHCVLGFPANTEKRVYNRRLVKGSSLHSVVTLQPCCCAAVGEFIWLIGKEVQLNPYESLMTHRTMIETFSLFTVGIYYKLFHFALGFILLCEGFRVLNSWFTRRNSRGEDRDSKTDNSVNAFFPKIKTTIFEPAATINDLADLI